MVVLTSKQKEELNTAIYDYLTRNKYIKSAEMVAEEATIDTESTKQSGGASKLNNLENKWTTVVKL